MKFMCIILSFTLFVTGCYTHATVTNTTPLPPHMVEISFRLHDGTYLLSNEYERVEHGYKVVGKLVNKENRNTKDFSGFVSDEQIKEVVTNEFSIGKTALAVALTVVILVGGTLLILDASGIYVF